MEQPPSIITTQGSYFVDRQDSCKLSSPTYPPVYAMHPFYFPYPPPQNSHLQYPMPFNSVHLNTSTVYKHSQKFNSSHGLPSPTEEFGGHMIGGALAKNDPSVIPYDGMDFRKKMRGVAGERPYVCTIPGCGKSFTQLGNLKTHERKHTGEKPYKCSFPGCVKTFSQMGNMKTHELLHAGVKPFTCCVDGCNRSFTQLGNLKSHQQKLHFAAEKKPKENLKPNSSTKTDVKKKPLKKFSAKKQKIVKPVPRIAVPVYYSDDEEETKEECDYDSGMDTDRTRRDSISSDEAELLLKLKAVISKNDN